MSSSRLQSEIDFGRALVERGLMKEEEVRESLDLLRRLADLHVHPLPRLADLLARKGYKAALSEAETVRLNEPVPEAAQDWPEEAVAAARDPANLVDKYVRVRKVGVGGMGEVWKAWDRDLGRWVALKFLRAADEAEQSRFRLEAQTAARLDHPHVTAVYEANERYIAMQFVDGRSLSAFPRDDRPKLVEILRQAATAVHYAHRQGVIHRDLKPANILVAAGDPAHAYVTDFGLAKRMNVASSISVSGTIVGTPGYMSPEQTCGSKNLDGRTDVYSLGATLYELLTGRPPFRNENIYETFRQVVESDPTPIRLFEPQVKPDLETIAMKCLEKDPSRRYPNALELALDLERFLQGEPVQARPISRLARLWRKVRRHRAVLLPVAAVFLAGAAFGGWTLLRAERTARANRRLEERETKARAIQRVVARWNGLVAALGTSEPRVAQFLRETPSDSASQATALAYAGAFRWMNGRREEGEKLLREAQALEPDAPYAHWMEARLLLFDYQEQTPDRILRIGTGTARWDSAAGENPAMVRMRRRIAELIERMQDSRLILLGTRSVDLTATIEGLKALHDGNYERAEAAFTVALSAPNPSIDGESLFEMRAQARFFRGDFAGARDDLREATRRWKDRLPALLIGGSISLLQAILEESKGGDARAYLTEALATYDRYLQLDPNKPSVWANRSLARAKVGAVESEAEREEGEWFQKAIADGDEAVRRDPEAFWAYNVRGMARYHQGMAVQERGNDSKDLWEGASRDFEETLRRNPRFAEAYVNRGLVGLSSGAFDSALADFDAALKLDPQLAEARNGRGLALRMRGRFDEAIAEFRGAVAARPSYFGALYNLGDTYVMMGNGPANPRESLEKAVACYTEALRIKPDHVHALCNRAVAYTHLGRVGDDSRPFYDKAIQDCTEGLKINPEWAYLYNNRGNAYWKRGLAERALRQDPRKSFEAALADLDAAVRKKPDYALAFVTRGAVLDCLGRTAEAIASFERALQLDSSLTFVQSFLDDARKRLSDKP